MNKNIYIYINIFMQAPDQFSGVMCTVCPSPSWLKCMRKAVSKTHTSLHGSGALFWSTDRLNRLRSYPLRE